MSASNVAAIFNYLIWILVVIIGTYFGNHFLKLKKLGLKSEILKILVQNAVTSYEESNLSNSTKKKAVVKEVATSLRSKGFKVSNQTLTDIEQSVETAVKEIQGKEDNDGKA